jgi:putative acetyltransferase
LLPSTVPTIAIEDPRQADVLDLLQQGDQFGLSLYPAEHYHGLDVAALSAPGVSLYVAREDGVAIGTAAIVEHADGTHELKRTFVTDAARGLGTGRALLEAVEAHARGVGADSVRLETGLPQVAAIALYERAGFRPISPFGSYVHDPTSYCMEKRL